MKQENKQKSKINKKVILYSSIGLASLALVFLVDWIFIIAAVFMVWLNHKELAK